MSGLRSMQAERAQPTAPSMPAPATHEKEIPGDQGAAKEKDDAIPELAPEGGASPRKRGKQLMKSASLTANAAVVWKSSKQKNASKSGGRERQFDVFLSYRQDADIDLVKDLYWQLSSLEIVANGKKRKMEVFWDRESFELGKSWETAMPAAICNSTLVVAVLSAEAFQKEGAKYDMTGLREDSDADFVLLVSEPPRSSAG